VKPLLLSAFTATSCLGRGVGPTLATLQAARTGLVPCAFETVALDTYIGEVSGVDDTRLPPGAAEFECRNNRLAWLGLTQDGFAEAVLAAAARYGRQRVGIFLGTSTSGILDSELAYRARDPATGTLPASFRYHGAHNTFSVAAFTQSVLGLKGPAVVISCVGAARPRRRRDRRSAGRRGGLAVPHDALWLSFAAAGVIDALPPFRCGSQRHLHR
jgi:3-oxoacyl-[acyl-carrier-protein] synthase-1